MRKQISTLVIILCLFPSTAFAEKVVIGTIEDVPPYVYRENGQWTGTDVEISREAAKRLGIEIEYKGYPWARLMAMAELDQIDGVLSFYYTEQEFETLSQFLNITSEFMYIYSAS